MPQVNLSDVRNESPRDKALRIWTEVARDPQAHPIRVLAEIAYDPTASVSDKRQAASDALGYIMPKLKQTEHTGENGGPMHMVISAKPLDMDQWQKQYGADKEPEADA